MAEQSDGRTLPATVTRTIELDVRLPQPKLTERVEVRRIRMAAGTHAGLHVHNGPVFGSIVTGTVIFQLDGEPEIVLGPGDVFYEPETARIARFDAGDTDVEFLGYFLLAADQQPELEFPE
ncbi:cupin domain-containing protein [Nocardia sp. NBC_01388]|uniref:cupin domain-containing protein n=1 Tax=Nocardia sp. NBC_01388 TaxID=2903596 RepID=UPI00324DAC8C